MKDMTAFPAMPMQWVPVGSLNCRQLDVLVHFGEGGDVSLLGPRVPGYTSTPALMRPIMGRAGIETTSADAISGPWNAETPWLPGVLPREYEGATEMEAAARAYVAWRFAVGEDGLALAPDVALEFSADPQVAP